MRITLEVPIEITVARQMNTGEAHIIDIDDSQLDCAIKFLKDLQSLSDRKTPKNSWFTHKYE